MFSFQEDKTFFAVVAGGLEDDGLKELAALGATNLKRAYRGVYFSGDLKTLYKVNYQSRLLTRVLAPLAKFKAFTPEELTLKLKAIPWEMLLSPKQTFAVFSTSANSKINHSQYAGLLLKDAICDRLRDLFNDRPSIDKENPDLWFNLHIERDFVTVSLDTSGGSLHKRGYRQKTVAAPMQETVAAAFIQFADWDFSRPLHDFMCGSGTLLAEALMLYCRIPAQYLRQKFGFKFLPGYSERVWQNIKKDADAAIRPLTRGLISGSDINNGNLEIARGNLALLPSGENVDLTNKDYKTLRFDKPMFLIANPPYGIRLGGKADALKIYEEIGPWAKQMYGSALNIYACDQEAEKKLALKPDKRKNMVNGAIEGKVLSYSIYPPLKKDTE